MAENRVKLDTQLEISPDVTYFIGTDGVTGEAQWIPLPNTLDALAEPNTQLVYGTGASVDSNSNLTYDSSTGILTMLDSVSGQTCLSITDATQGDTFPGYMFFALNPTTADYTQISSTTTVLHIDVFNTGSPKVQIQIDGQPIDAVYPAGMLISIDGQSKAEFTVDSFDIRPNDNQDYELRFYEKDPAGGTNFVGLKAPDALGNDLTYIFPDTDPTEGQTLKAHAPSAGKAQLYWG